MATKIQFRRDTATNWSSNDPVLAEGEIGLDTTNSQFKIGDGVTAWSSLGVWSEGVLYSVHEYTATEGQVDFPLSYDNTQAIEVLINGFTLSTTDYTKPDNTRVTLDVGASLGDLVVIKVFRNAAISNVVSKAGDTMTGVLTLPGLVVNSTGSIELPTGTTEERPVSPVQGMFRYNTDLNDIEYYNGSVWLPNTQSQTQKAVAFSLIF